jgi:DNA-binding XRE family transcriptional regulator
MPLQPGNIIKYKVRNPLGLFSKRLAKHQGATPASINDIERAWGKELLLKKCLSQADIFLMKLEAMHTYVTNVSLR